MKASEVLRILKVSRVTLSNYVKTGRIKAIKKENGTYDYDDESIYRLIGKHIRKDAVYGRVSTHKQKKELVRQVNELEKYMKKINNENYDI